MADKRERHRMVFECPEEIKRAIRARAGIEGVSPADVILAALRAYLGPEIDLAVKRLQEEAGSARQGRKPRES